MIFWCVLSFLLVGLDRLTKFLTVKNFDLGESITIIPNLLDFTYVKNTGAAFSILENATWVLSIISVIFCILIAVYFFVKKPKSRLLKSALVLIFSGALGNAIDRVFLGYVIDFIQTTFISFPVFNVADIAITVGAVLLIIYELFFNPEAEKGDK